MKRLAILGGVALLGLLLGACAEGVTVAPSDCGPVVEGPLALNIEVNGQVTRDTVWTRYKECVDPPRVVIVP